MSEFYRIKGLPGLEGLVVETTSPLWEGRAGTSATGHSFRSVESLINPNAVLGDRTVKFPLPKGKLLIDAESLELVPDPTQEYSTKSPFGKLLFEGSLKRDEIRIDYVSYDNAITVTIREDHGTTGRTVYTQNFFGNYWDQAMALVEATMTGETDVEELVFQLKDLKDKELRETN